MAQSLILGVPDSEYVLNAANWAWGYNLGVIVEPMDGMRLGLTYRSAFSYSYSTAALQRSANEVSWFDLTTAPARFNIKPSCFHHRQRHAAQIAVELSLSSDVQFTQRYGFKEVLGRSRRPIPFSLSEEKYRDSWMASVGGEYQLDDTWQLRGNSWAKGAHRR